MKPHTILILTGWGGDAALGAAWNDPFIALMGSGVGVLLGTFAHDCEGDTR